jgi:hypothetical protein
VRHRSKVVEYLVKEYKKVLGKRLAAVNRAPPFVATVVTTEKPAL